MALGPRIKLADPVIESAEQENVQAVLKSGWLVTGPKGKNFEQELGRLVGREHVTAVSSGTAALFAAMRAMGIGRQSRVIVPAFTFPAPAAAAAFLGAQVVPCDVDAGTFCISPETLSPHLEGRISLVVAIDQFGMPAPVPALEKMLKSRGIPILVDAACSLGSTLDGKPCGSFGRAAAMSFHPRKIITTGEGGAVLTNDEELAAAIRQLVNHGLEDKNFKSVGLNLRLSEISASLGLAQLCRLEAIVRRRRALAERYRKTLNVKFQASIAGASSNYQTLAFVLPDELTRTDRDDLLEFLDSEGIEARIASYCLGAEQAIARQMRIDDEATPNAGRLAEGGVALPLHPNLSTQDVDRVCEAVSKWLRSRGVESSR